MIDQLSVIASGRRMGWVQRHANHLTFHYDEQWRRYPERFPLSFSMPLSTADHSHEAIESFIWGLLPDNDQVLNAWGKQFHVSPRHPYRLIAHVGQDCAGAIQFIPTEQENQLLGDEQKGEVKWLTKKQLTQRMQLLVQDHSAARTGVDDGQFSLAGAQAKTALHFDPLKKRWGVPSGTIPTTHILKPATEHFHGHAENEHFCLSLANALGLPAAASEIIHFGDTPVIIVERYDRLLIDGEISRIHQEDFCQALATRPHLKYQSDGGPSVKQITECLREFSTDGAEGVDRFADALILNWLIKGTDAHAKNYSMLIVSSDLIRLAPLYDIASALPYANLVNPHKARLAMKVGSEYLIKKIERRHWQACGKDLGLKGQKIFGRIESMVERMPKALEVVQERMAARGVQHPVTDQLVKEILKNCQVCLKQIAYK